MSELPTEVIYERLNMYLDTCTLEDLFDTKEEFDEFMEHCKDPNFENIPFPWEKK
jgi:hypothetical protein